MAMVFPKRIDYAIRGVYCLARLNRPAFVREISQAEKIPEAPLAKVFQVLVHHGILSSSRGRKGGFLLALPPRMITLRRIFEALDGPLVIEQCLFIDEKCGRKDDCLVYDSWKEAVRQVMRVLSATLVPGF